jgi:tetratricopeptide (TPR) repeat protein
MAMNGIDQRREIADLKLDFGRLYWLQGKWYEQDGRQRKERAIVESAYNKYTSAISVSREAMFIYEEIQDNRGIAKTWGNLGNATKEIVRFLIIEGRLTEAIERIAEAHNYYERSLQLAEQIQRRDEKAHALWGLAEVYELYFNYPDLSNRSGNRRTLLEIALKFAQESHWRYIFLGGVKDIRATESLIDRIRNKLSVYYEDTSST